MKVVADTMIWVSYCTLQVGMRHRLIRQAIEQRVRFYVSEYILDELVEVLIEDLQLGRRYAMLARRAVLRIAKQLRFPAPRTGFVPGDPDDDAIVQTALTAGADYLVTADKQLLEIGKIHSVEVITPVTFKRKLDARQKQ